MSAAQLDTLAKDWTPWLKIGDLSPHWFAFRERKKITIG